MMKLAGHAMTALLLVTVVLAADPVPKVAPEPLPPEPKSDPTNVRELYDAYRYYGLPLPPKGSYLGKTITRSLYTRDGIDTVDSRTTYELISPGKPSFLRRKPEPVEPTRQVLTQLAYTPISPTIMQRYASGDWLFFSSQAHHLGWTEAAGIAFDRGKRELESEEGETPILNCLKTKASQYHYKQLLEPNSDRRLILAHMRRAYIHDDPESFREQMDFTANLARTIRLDWHRPGSDEDWIAGLATGNTTDEDILAKGFDAVPTLIRHLGDTRLTRQTKSYLGGNTFGTSLLNVQMVCINLLDAISSDTINRHQQQVEFLDDTENYYSAYARKADVWFRYASAVGEEKWCLRNVITMSKSGRPENRNDALVSILRAKYPHHLLTVFKQCEGHRVDWEPLLLAIATSRLTENQKKGVFNAAERQPDSWNPLIVVAASRSLGLSEFRSRFRKLLLAIHEGKRPASDLDELRTRHNPATLVHEADDAECWTLFRHVLSKLSVESRASMAYWGVRNQNHERFAPHTREQLRSELVLLGDLSNPSKLNSMSNYANKDGYRIHTIGDLSALMLAEELGIDIPWKPDRTPAEWAAIRENVRVAAEKAIEHSK